MKHSQVFLHPSCVTTPVTRTKGSSLLKRTCRFVCVFGFLAFAACLPFPLAAFGQIQSTITCPAGHGYWDVLSVMMMDPGLAAGYHMEGITDGLPSAYIYTIWDPTQTKVYYVKNPQGNPWDINLYDDNYIYQWVTELDDWDGVNHWNDPTSCKKFNNGFDTSTSDFSMRWASRCAAPGGENSTIWNSPPPSEPYSTNYYTYIDQVIQSPQNLSNSLLRLGKTTTMPITDNRADPPITFPITILPLEYIYSCKSQEISSCLYREVFDYGLDTTVNPVDHIKHSYGWVNWTYYVNTTGGNVDLDPVWELSNTTTQNQVMPGQVNINFQCF
jgi:hypothetical protein